MKASPVNLSGVPETMLWTLHNRASEVRRPDAFLHDPECLRIYESIDYDYARSFGKPDASHPMRSRIFDDAMRPWLAAHPGGTVIELGVGLETQFQRVDDGRVRWLCVDVPEAITVRERFLPPSERCRYIAKSALDLSWLDEVDGARSVFISAQGLFMYFEEADVQHLFVAIAERFASVELMFDTIPRWFSKKTLRGFGKTVEVTTRQTSVARSFQIVKSTIKPSEIPSAPEKDAGWQELDAPGMLGSVEAFDANANLPWANAIARNWSNDAELESVYLLGVKSDGTLDLSARPDHEADYRFASKHLWAAHEKLQQVSESQLTLQFRVRVSAGKVTFLGSKPLNPRKPELGPVPAKFQCPLATVMETAGTDGLEPRPFYDLMGRYLAHRKQWAWLVSAKDTHANHRIAVDASGKRL